MMLGLQPGSRRHPGDLPLVVRDFELPSDFQGPPRSTRLQRPAWALLYAVV
jgi:hypothetical protein